MKKINYFYIISGIFFCLILTNATTTTVAWSNGEVYTRPAFPIQTYLTDYMSVPPTTKKEYYATHDWVAESALMLLRDKQPLNVFLQKLSGITSRDGNLRMWFLWGSELPDAFPYVDFATARTDCGYTFLRSDFSPDHTPLVFDVNNKKVKAKTPFSADRLARRASLALKEGDCQKAAVFLGAMMHVIADATFYVHLLDDVGIDHTYKRRVGYLTYKTWPEGDRKGTGSPEFFRLTEARNEITLFTGLISANIYASTLFAGLDTHTGALGSYFTPAEMHAHRPGGGESYWDKVNGPINSNRDVMTWTYEDRPEHGYAKKYFATIEHNLNVAVYTSAEALGVVMKDYKSCECSDENPPTEEIIDSQKSSDKSGVKVSVSKMHGLVLFSMTGLMSSFLAFAFLSSVPSLLEKLPLPY